MSRKIITITRGDTYISTINIAELLNCNTKYLLNENEYLFFGIMTPHQSFDDAMVRLSLSKSNQNEDGTITINIPSKYTEQMLPGVYFYSIKLVSNLGKSNENVQTILNKTKFIVND